MKKKILFVIDSLNCAGSEKSLVTLLSLLDYSKYKVDLQLLGYGGELEEFIPTEVNILKPLEYTQFTSLNIMRALVYSIKRLNFNMLISRLKYTLRIRKAKYSNIEQARFFWKYASHVMEENQNDYDIAISYAQGVPTFYVASKVKAKKKFTWVNEMYNLNNVEKEFQTYYYNQFNNIVTVSHEAQKKFNETFPEFINIMVVLYDIINPQIIDEMSNFQEKPYKQYSELKILTIARLANGKGYDIALEACRILKERGIDFKWYVLGKGPLENDIKQYIQKYHLEDYFILLGIKSNPYPYIKNADIYVQTSMSEGFGLAIAEARMLNIPVVTTRFDAVFNQMNHKKNGLVVDMDGEAVCNGIIQLINDQNLRKEIINYLEHEKKGNVEEIEKFYQLIG